jgi:hypothetical protein
MWIRNTGYKSAFQAHAFYIRIRIQIQVKYGRNRNSFACFFILAVIFLDLDPDFVGTVLVPIYGMFVRAEEMYIKSAENPRIIISCTVV